MSEAVNFAGLAAMLPSLGALIVTRDDADKLLRTLKGTALQASGRPLTRRVPVRIYAAIDEVPVDVTSIEVVKGIEIEADGSGADIMTEADGTFELLFTLPADVKPTEIVACTNCLYKVANMSPPIEEDE